MGAVCASVLAFSVFTGQATANTLDFGIGAPTSGSLSYAGGGAALIGSGIQVDDVVGLETPSNDNVTSLCDSCLLDFTTGGSTGSWVFGSGGTITITGGIDFPDATPDITDTNTVLLSGTFDSAQILDLGSGQFEFQILGASFTDTKDPDLLSFYGLPDVQYIGGMNLSFQTSAAMGESFTTTDLLSGDVVNQPVPVPAAVWLFGAGLLGLVGVARRKD